MLLYSTDITSEFRLQSVNLTQLHLYLESSIFGTLRKIGTFNVAPSQF